MRYPPLPLTQEPGGRITAQQERAAFQAADNRRCARYLLSALAGGVVFWSVLLAPVVWAAVLALLAMAVVSSWLRQRCGDADA